MIDGDILCEYDGVGTKDSCREVVVTVDGLVSNNGTFCYDADRGEMIFDNFPPRVTEMETFQYSIGLSTGLVRSANVVVTLEAVSAKPELECTVSPTVLIFYPDNTTYAVNVRTDGNQIDEGTEATAYSCEISHSIESTDSQCVDCPPETLTANIINDDEANVKLWTINEDTAEYEYDVKFLPFLSKKVKMHRTAFVWIPSDFRGQRETSNTIDECANHLGALSCADGCPAGVGI